MATGQFKVNLSGCTISDQSCKYVVKGLKKRVHRAVTTLLTLNLSYNAITTCGVRQLSTLLSLGCIEDISLGFSTTFTTITRLLKTGHNELGSLRGTVQSILHCYYFIGFS